MAFSRITLAISDQCPGGLEGFAPLSERLTASVFEAAIEDGKEMLESGKSYCVRIDLMAHENSQIGEKTISLEQAGEILGLPPASLIQLGRQRLAQIDDEHHDYIMRRQARPGRGA